MTPAENEDFGFDLCSLCSRKSTIRAVGCFIFGAFFSSSNDFWRASLLSDIFKSFLLFFGSTNSDGKRIGMKFYPFIVGLLAILEDEPAWQVARYAKELNQVTQLEVVTVSKPVR